MIKLLIIIISIIIIIIISSGAHEKYYGRFHISLANQAIVWPAIRESRSPM